MYRQILVAFILLVAAATAIAEPSKPRGFYLVGAAGESLYDEAGSFGLYGDDDDRSLHLAIGYKILRYLSVEARFVDLGSFSIPWQDIYVDVSARSIHAVGIVPFGQSGWEFFGQLGIGTVSSDFSGDLNSDESAVAGGFGFRWFPTPKFAIGIQTDVYVWDNESGSASTGANQLSLQVIF